MDMAVQPYMPGYPEQIQLFGKVYLVSPEVIDRFLPNFFRLYELGSFESCLDVTEFTPVALDIIFKHLQESSYHGVSTRFIDSLEKMFKHEYSRYQAHHHSHHRRYRMSNTIAVFMELCYLLSPQCLDNDSALEFYSYLVNFFNRHWEKAYNQDPLNVVLCIDALDKMNGSEGQLHSILVSIARKPEKIRTLLHVTEREEMKGTLLLSEEILRDLEELAQRRGPPRQDIVRHVRGGRHVGGGRRKGPVCAADMSLKHALLSLLEEPEDWFRVRHGGMRSIMDHDDFDDEGFGHGWQGRGRIRGFAQRKMQELPWEMGGMFGPHTMNQLQLMG